MRKSISNSIQCAATMPLAATDELLQVVELILTPFHDIVDKATAAANNAQGEEPLMQRTADALAREGRRALNRLEPLSKKTFNQHGAAFVNAIKSNDDISSFHLELTDSLWEFDDYVAIETFDQDKYAELQALCRKVAPKIYNILVRMNIELLAKGSDHEPPPPQIMPESPIMFPTSPSPYSWQVTTADMKVDPDARLLGASSPWSDSSLNRFPIQSHPRSSHSTSDSQVSRPYSTLAASVDFANMSRDRQSYSSGQSSGSSGSHSSRIMGHNSITTIRESEALSSPVTAQSWPLPERLSSRTNRTTATSSDMMPDSPDSKHVSGEYKSENRRKRVTFEHSVSLAARLPSKQCVIDEYSSFHRYKGFCSGAREVLRGNDGVKQKQKPVHRTLSRIVAKCTGCSMELDYEHIEIDLANRESGNLTKRDVEYRLRFLQKSHLPVKRATDALYACVFCIHNGYTTEESDATVFFTADDLFTHLSRHPRPLPNVPGITVVYGLDIPSNFQNNYDVHFRSQPKPHPSSRDNTEIDGRPTGIATKEVRRVESQRSLVDRDRPEELQVAAGARLTGIKWPPQYKGRRIFAWHDGSFASVPSEIVMLIPPSGASRLSRDMRSFVSGKAKWKFVAKHGKDVPWLKFDKGDAISNIGWEHPDHWCWCGTNAKGEWGIFPQAFIDPNTVQDSTPYDYSPRV